MKKTITLRIFLVLAGVLSYLTTLAQDECPHEVDKRAQKLFGQAVDEYKSRKYDDALKNLTEALDLDVEYADAYYLRGLIYVKRYDRNVKIAAENFQKVIEICPSFEPYAYYYLGDISFGAEQYDLAEKYFDEFLQYPDKIKNEQDFDRASRMYEQARILKNLINNPVPFAPKYVKGISSKFDEYLPIISPDNELAFFTRKVEMPKSKDSYFAPEYNYKERFFVSRKINGQFEYGEPMPYPFNVRSFEGAATITADNKEIFFTGCESSGGYYNCDIFYSEQKGGYWTEVKRLGENINKPDSWESQPSVTTNGTVLYFSSDRKGGYGGYDLYKIVKNENEEWSAPINLGPLINSDKNEKSPFIHTDSQTLYFSSDGWPGIGGYDIFFSKLDADGVWSKPRNIGYPINSIADDLGFFVSTDGRYGYFASNKIIDGPGGYDLYSFELYKEARPEKVLFIKGEVKNEETNETIDAKVELVNASTKQVTEIPIDYETGKYIAVLPFKNDFILTVKKEDFIYESRYIAKKDSTFQAPKTVDIELKPIAVGKSYRLNDIYFATASAELTEESELVLEEFIKFMTDNPKVKVAIHGHTDNVGTLEDNQMLSEARAKSVYDYLVAHGLDQGRFGYYKGFGETKPIESNLAEEGRAINRRTEIVIISK